MNVDRCVWLGRRARHEHRVLAWPPRASAHMCTRAYAPTVRAALCGKLAFCHRSIERLGDQSARPLLLLIGAPHGACGRTVQAGTMPVHA